MGKNSNKLLSQKRINTMDAKSEHKELRELRNLRNEAALHLERAQKQMDGMEWFLPSLSQGVVIELADYIERLNERIEEKEQKFTHGNPQQYVQAAFEFLVDCAIRDGEIPF